MMEYYSVIQRNQIVPYAAMDGHRNSHTEWCKSDREKQVSCNITFIWKCTIALISHTSKAMLKILQARLQQHVNRELPDVQTGFRKDRGTRDQIANIHWIMEKAREFQKNFHFCFIDYAKAFDCVDHNKLWKIHKEMGIPDHLICLLRNLYAGQKQQHQTWHNGLIPNWERSTSRLYIFTLLI